MTTFHEEIRSVLTEVEKFLVETIKKVSLNKAAKDHKELILEKVAKLRNEFPALLPENKQEASKSTQESPRDGSGGTIESTNSLDNEEGTSYNIASKPAADLKEPECSGFLDKKQNKSKLTGGWKFQKRWCVIKDRILYYYESKKDKKQNGAFRLDGYEFTNAPDLVKDSAKKALCFQLSCPDKRTYEFQASSTDDYDRWQTAVSVANGDVIQEDIYDCVEPESKPKTVDSSYEITDEPDNVSISSKKSADKQFKPVPAALDKLPKTRAPAPDPVEEMTYEDTGATGPQPTGDTEDMYDEGFSGTETPLKVGTAKTDQVYDDGFTDATQDETYEELDNYSKDNEKGLREPPPPPPTSHPPTSHPPTSHPPTTFSSRQQTSSPPPRPPVSSPPGLKTRTDPGGRRAPPLVPPQSTSPEVPKPVLKIKKPSEDFENMFYGMWDCIAGTDRELSFKRGEIIHIINRELDSKSWWVGEKDGSFGLVPKNYLTPAFEQVAA
ncbi:hypothetical protein ScPMuIL_013158 [Solemya velum]